MAVTKKTSKVALLEQSVTENPSNLNVSLSPFLLLQPLWKIKILLAIGGFVGFAKHFTR